VFPCAHKKDIILDGGRKVCGQRILKLDVLVHIAFKCALSYFAVAIFHQGVVEIPLRHFNLFSFAIFCGCKLEIRIDQHTSAVICAAHWVCQRAEQFLHFAGTDVFLLAEEVSHTLAVDTQILVFDHPVIQRGFANLKQFRIEV